MGRLLGLLMLVGGGGVAVANPEVREAVTAPFEDVVEEVRDQVTDIELRQMSRDLVAEAIVGNYPTDDRAFRRWLEDYYSEVKSTLDAWDRPYRFTSSGESFELRSAGRDGVFGNADDRVLEARRGRRAVAPARGF